MKNFNLFKSPKQLLKYTLTLVSALVIFGAVLVICFGFNTSPDFAGYYNISISVNDVDDTNKYADAINNVLNDYAYKSYSLKVEDKSYLYTINVEYKSKSEENAKQIKQDLIKVLELNEEQDVISVEKVEATYAGKTVWKIAVAEVVAVAVLFLYGLLRHKDVYYGLTYVIISLATFIIGLSIFAVTRTILSLSSLAILAVMSVVACMLFAYISTIANTEKQSHTGQNKQVNELYNEALTKNVLTVGLPIALIVAVFIALMLSFTTSLVFVGLSGIISVISAIVSCLFVGTAFYLTILNYKQNKQNLVLSRNEKPAQTKTQTTTKKASKVKKADNN